MGLKEKRLDKGISMRELSKISGVSRPTIKELEDNKRVAHEHTLAKLAKSLGCNIEELRNDKN